MMASYAMVLICPIYCGVQLPTSIAILRGGKPGELPVQAPTKYELTLNLKIAGALGLTIPPNLIAIADEVIQ